MSYEHKENIIESDENGYLVNADDWSKDLAEIIAASDGIKQTEKHWDILDYLRSEYFSNAGSQPMERTIKKAMEKQWQTKLSSKQLYELFPESPSKQGLKIAGLPPTTRKGGY